jgi:hypothetical protein
VWVQDVRALEDRVLMELKVIEGKLHDQQKEMEKIKLDIIKMVFGTMLSAAGLGIGIWRLLIATTPKPLQAPPPSER